MKICGIYKITSPTNRVYIGQSVDILYRIKMYSYLNCKTQRKLYNSLKKHGYENHKFEIIEMCSIDDLNKRERFWQEHYNATSNKGLNCVLTGSSDKKGEVCDYTKELISSKSKKWYSENKHPRLGIKISEDLRSKFSKIRKGLLCGVKNPNYGKKGALNHNYGKKRDKSTIDKITGENNHKSMILFNTNTGIYYYGIREAAESLGWKRDRLKQHLFGLNRTNRTHFKKV